MLLIKTDLKDREWLEYILEEFKRINKALFDIKVIGLAGAPAEDRGHTIYYTKEFSGRNGLANRSSLLPRGKVRFISDNLFIIEGTQSDDRRYICKYDLFWNAFVFLSRFEEYLSEEEGAGIKSYSLRHPRTDRSTFFVPIVNILFDEFERIIKEMFPDLEFGQKDKPVIELSHDIDYLEKTVQLRLKQTTFNIYNSLCSLYSPVRFLANISKTASFLFSGPSYWGFDYWEDLEKSLGRRSVFYVYAKTGKKKIGSWMLDPSYDISTHQRLRDKLKYLIAEGFEVGLHASSNSSRDAILMEKEKTLLEERIGTPITKVRQHWLCYEEKTTPYIHERLFKYDSTLGWNDIPGFRSGCASRYRPYDHKGKRPFNIIETPQIIMDSHIFDYGAKAPDKAVKRVTRMLEGLHNYKTPFVSISWHQRVCNSDYQRQGLYKNLITNEYI